MTQERPWLQSYPPNVPQTLEPYPVESLFALLEGSARRSPDKPAIAWFGRHLSYGDVLHEVERCSAMLASLGVGKGDRVSLIMPNCPPFVIAFYACQRLGAIAVGNNPLYTKREMNHQLKDTAPTAVLVADLMYADFAEVFAELGIEQVVVVRLNDYMPVFKRLLAPVAVFRKQQKAAGKPWPPVPKGAPAKRWRAALKTSAPVPPVATVDPKADPAAFVYTGGTTGIAKGAVLSHANLASNARQSAAWMEMTDEGTDAVLAAMPFFHSFGMVSMNLAILKVGKLIPVPNPRDLHMILELIDHEKPTLFPGVPRIYIALNEHPQTPKFDLKSLKACISGAAPLPSAVAKEFERITGAQVVEGYGLTECSPVTHANPLHGKRREGCIGLPIPDTQCRLVSLEDPDRDMKVGEPGELCIRGPQVMLGYWNRPEETALAIRNGWFHTGDVAVMDDDGYFKIVDRLKDMILVSGFNVYPNEVEDVLFHHPKISKCAVVGVPDDRTGERVKAFVVLKSGESLTPEELIGWCKDPAQGLTGYRAPHEIEFRDTLPETLVGKVLRRALQDEERKKRQATTPATGR
ncbi:MAG: long-chain-fatty-acid--CoA ligase [Actinomycetota bacterium]